VPRPIHHRRLRRFFPAAIVVTLFVPALSVGPATASPIDDQERRVQELTDELERLQERSDKFAEVYNVALREQGELTEEIEEAEARIARKELRVGGLRDDLSSVAVDAFVDAGSGGFGPLFESSDSYSETRQRQEYSRVALSVGSDTTDDLDEAVADLEADRDDLADKRAEAEDLAQQAADAKEQTESSTAEYVELRADAEAELGRLIQEEEERRAREAYEKILAEQARQQQLEAERVAREQAAAEAAQEQAAEQAAQEQAAEQAAQEQAAADAAQEQAADAAQEQAVEQETTTAPAPQAPAPSDSGDDSGSTESGSSDSGSTDSGSIDSGDDASGSTDSDSGSTDSGDDDSASDSGDDDTGSTDSGDDEPSGYAPPPPPPPPEYETPSGPSSLAQVAINAAMSEIGTPWVFAMAQPGVGFDCSGLTSWAWAQAGVSMPHQSAQQYASLPHVPVSSAQPGDLLFSYSPISHVGIYLGNGQQVHSPNSTTTVKVAPVRWENVVGAARPG
jgi:cell wall-associated NlpC family hydrolase